MKPSSNTSLFPLWSFSSRFIVVSSGIRHTSHCLVKPVRICVNSFLLLIYIIIIYQPAMLPPLNVSGLVCQQCITVKYSTAQYSTVQCNAVQCSFCSSVKSIQGLEYSRCPCQQCSDHPSQASLDGHKCPRCPPFQPHSPEGPQYNCNGEFCCPV